MVDCIRRRFHMQRVGHGGTLDPAATGLLILLLGTATRQAQHLLEADKTYFATLRLGISTDTQDGEGTVLENREVGSISAERIEAASQKFRGAIQQETPAYSAARVQGRRSYELARAGLPVPRRIRQVTVRELTILDVRLPEIDLKVICSKGTYIRTLCSDLGSALGVGGHLARLRRVQIGPFSVEKALPPESCRPEDILPVDRLS